MPQVPPESPLPSAVPSARSRSASARLDPYGIYGTRSSQRMQSSRRRRQVQSGFALAGLVGLAVVALAAVRIPRIPRGKVVWTAHLRARPAAAPATLSADQLLVPTASGELLLVTLTATGASEGTPVLTTGFPLLARPVVLGEVAFVPCQDGTLYAVNWKSRQVAWTYSAGASLSGSPVLVPLDLPLGHRDLGQPRPSDRDPSANALIFGDDDGKVTAVNAGSGKLIWTKDAGGPVGQGIAGYAAARRVYVPVMPGVAARGGLLCLDLFGGKPVWRFPTDPHVFGAGLMPPVLDNRDDPATVRLVFATDDGFLVRLDAATGRRDAGFGWKSAAEAGPETPNSGIPLSKGHGLVVLRGQPTYSSPNPDTVFVGANDGGLRAFNRDNGQLKWIFGTGAPIHLGAEGLSIEAKSGFLVAAETPYLWALAPDGSVLRRWRLFAPATGLQVWEHGVLAVERDGTLQFLAP